MKRYFNPMYGWATREPDSLFTLYEKMYDFYNKHVKFFIWRIAGHTENAFETNKVVSRIVETPRRKVMVAPANYTGVNFYK